MLDVAKWESTQYGLAKTWRPRPRMPEGEKLLILAMIEMGATDEPACAVGCEDIYALVNANLAKYDALLRDPNALKAFMDEHRPLFPGYNLPDNFEVASP